MAGNTSRGLENGVKVVNWGAARAVVRAAKEAADTLLHAHRASGCLEADGHRTLPQLLSRNETFLFEFICSGAVLPFEGIDQEAKIGIELKFGTEWRILRQL